MYDSDSAGRGHSDVKKYGSYECAACVVAINIKINLVQGINFNTENFKSNYFHNSHT